jgi:hypothetical protein
MPLGTLNGIISIRQLLTGGAEPYLAIKVQGNIPITRGVVAIPQLVHPFRAYWLYIKKRLITRRHPVYAALCVYSLPLRA